MSPSRAPLVLSVFAAVLLPACLGAQSAPAVPQQATPNIYPAAQQGPLTEDRDPVASPDDAAPQPGAKGQVEKGSGGFILKREVNEVDLNITVLDDKDRLISSLTKDDFRVYEDGVLQKINSFRHEDLPVSLGILIDDSGSMQPKRAAVNKAALDLVRLSNPQDETFIVNFSDDINLDQDFTSDLAKLNHALGYVDSRGGTAIYDAVYASADHMAQTAKRSRQVLLLITDGEDNSSMTTLEETVKRVQQLNGPVVYAIGLMFHDSPRNEERQATRTLKLLAQETGGVAYFPKDLGQVDDVATQVARDIRNQYVVGYVSTKPPELGGYRTVHVDVKARGYGKLSVRTRTGYYPEKSGAGKPAAAKNSAEPAHAGG